MKVGLLAALVAIAAMIGWFGADGVQHFDRAGLEIANAMRAHWLDAVFASLSWIGSLVLLTPLVVATGLLLWRRGWRDEARFLVVALGGASVLGHLAKEVARRPRPDLFAALTPVLSPLSFPSAHAVQVTAIAVAAWMLVRHLAPGHGRRALSVLVPIVVSVDFSRIYLQVHYPSDVLAGSIAGACWVFGLRIWMLKAARPTRH